MTSLGFGARLTGAAATSMGATRATKDAEKRMMDLSDAIEATGEPAGESRESLKERNDQGRYRAAQRVPVEERR